MSLGLGLGLHKKQIGLGITGLLDQFTGAAAAFSLDTLIYGDHSVEDTAVGSQTNGSTDTYTVRVRRSSDNAVRSFTHTEVGDGTLVTWVGAGNDGFVEAWYNQGSADDAVQTTASSQPKIVDAGVLVEQNGKPAVEFDGVDDGLETSSYFANFLHESESSVFAVASVNSGTSNGSAIISTTNQQNYESSTIGYYLAVDNRSSFTNRGGVFVTNGAGGYSIANITNQRYVDDQQYLISAISDPSNATAANRSLIYNDGANLLQENSQTGTPATGDSNSFLKIYKTLKSLKGIAQGIIIYPSDQSANRTAIESALNDYYKIY